MTGVEQPDSGTVTINQQKVIIRSPQHAQELGISTVYQETNLCPDLSVAENILIGREPMKWGVFIDKKTMADEARQILQGLGIRPGCRSNAGGVFGGGPANGGHCPHA